MKYQYNMQYNQAKGTISNQEQIKGEIINKTAIDIFFYISNISHCGPVFAFF